MSKLVEFNCVICGAQKRNYPQHHFGVANVCGACAVFFARNAHQRAVCRNGRNKCKLQNRSASLTGRNLCRSCRLNKCIRVGMQKKTNIGEGENGVERSSMEDTKGEKINGNNTNKKARHVTLMRMLLNEDPIDDAFLISSSQHNFLSVAGENNTTSSIVLSPQNWKFSPIFHTIRMLESIDRMMWAQLFKFHDREFRIDVLDQQFPSLMDMMSSDVNWFCNLDKFTRPSKFDKDAHVHIYLNKLMIILIILNLSLLRRMPHFSLLSSKDQCLIVGSLTFTIYELNNRVLSGCYTNGMVTLPNGASTNIFKLLHETFNCDRTVQNYVQILFRHTFEPFHRAQLTSEEFVLLRAIVATHPVISGLSTFAQKLLQKESERYADALMQLERHRLGEIAGIKRYAEILHLAENMFHVDRKYRDFNAYLAMVVDHGMTERMPKVVLNLCLDGAVAV